MMVIVSHSLSASTGSRATRGPVNRTLRRLLYVRVGVQVKKKKTWWLYELMLGEAFSSSPSIFQAPIVVVGRGRNRSQCERVSEHGASR